MDGPEDLGLDALQRVFQDRAQVADHVLAGGRGLRGQFPQVGGELDGQPLQVAQGGEVQRSGAAGPVAPSPRTRPVLPAAPPGPVRPARSLAPAAPARGVPVLLTGVEPGAGGLAEPTGGTQGLVAGPLGFLAEPLGLLVHPPRRLRATLHRLRATLRRLRATLPGFGIVLRAGVLARLLGLRASVLARLPGLLAGFVPGLPGLLADVGGHVPAHPAGLTSRPGQLLAEAAHGLPDVFPHLADDVADRRGQFLLELVKLVAPAAQLLAACLGDPVDLAAVYLVVSDQALFLQPGQPGIDRAWRGRVHAHEPVAQQPDNLIAVPGLLVQEPEQVQPEAAVAEYRTQVASPSISFLLSGCSRLARRSSMTRPDIVVTDACPEPAPRLPLTLRDAGAEVRLSSGNSLRTSPERECIFTWASASAGSLSVTSPDTVVTCIPPSGSRSMSAVTSPLTTFASRRSSQPSASVRSPDTVLKLSLPLIPWASSAPDTVLASTSPVTPSSV